MLLQSPLEPLTRGFAGAISILVYHRVLNTLPPEGEWEPNLTLSVSESAFESQIKYLSENFSCVSLEDAVQKLKTGTLGPRCVVVTFDDGYHDNLATALPILEKYHVPATIFIATGFIDSPPTPWWYEHAYHLRNLDSLSINFQGVRYQWSLKTHKEKDEAFTALNALTKLLSPKEQEELLNAIRSSSGKLYTRREKMLSWDEIRMLDKHPLITIGAHTHSHPVLTALSDEELKNELLSSKTRLEETLGHPVQYFAYPFGGIGQIGSREFNAVAREGFTAAVTTELTHVTKNHSKALFALPRLNIEFNDDEIPFKWKLSGVGAFVRGLVGADR